MTNLSYEDYQLKIAKKAKKKERKAKKKALKKLAQLNAVVDMKDEPKVVSITATGRPSAYTEEERRIFQARIDNEKKNIWRVCNQDPLQIIKHCEENVADERNAAIRFARQAALKWAKAQQARPF